MKMLESVFFNIPCKFVLTQHEYIPPDDIDDGCFIIRTAMLEHMLNDVISILILNQPLCVFVKFEKNGGRLFDRAVFQDTLNHSAAVWMCG